MKRSPLALFGTLTLLAVACGGLLYNQGNAFPCDYNAPENVRDKVCAPTEVCGVLGQCVRFVYEGPQFEGAPEAPNFDQIKRVHPQTLDSPVTQITVNASALNELLAIETPGDGGLPLSIALKLGTVTTLSSVIVSTANLRQVALANFDAGAELLSDDSVALLNGAKVSLPNSNALTPKGLRATEGVLAVLRSMQFATPPVLLPTALSVDLQGNVTQFLPEFDGGQIRVLDLRWPPPSKKSATADGRPILLTQRGMLIQDSSCPDGGVCYLSLTPEDDLTSIGIPIRNPRPQRLFFRHDLSGDVWSFARGKTAPDGGGAFPATVLSTWLLTRSQEAPTLMTRAWNDCTPCINARILAIAPNRDGIANVEVLCGSAGVNPSLNLVRVIGSASADFNDVCVTAPVTPSFDLTHATTLEEALDDAPPGQKSGRIVNDEAFGGGVLVGGSNGEVWHGPSFSKALPAFLDRVPLTVGSFVAPNGARVPLAVTDQYLAAPVMGPADSGLPTGYKVFDLRKTSDFVLDENERLLAVVGEGGGWGLVSSGDLIHLDVRPPSLGFGTFFSLDFGPRLVTARGEQTRPPFQGEAVTHADGGLISLVLTGDDSVYLVPVPGESTGRNGLPVVFPQLTPEPGSPIRSFALERTPIGTNGVDRVRGYAVTSRNLYLVSLSGEPARWSATSILLGGGEPLEVWMDNPRGGLARVGYRDGTIYSLPGGFLLARPGETGQPNQVLDYENLGGWPVAYSTSGLWKAYYDALPNGKLDNKLPDGRPGKPMEWRKVTLSDGREPWMLPTGDGGTVARQGVLNVLTGPVAAVDGGFAQVFTLSLYVDNAVYEIGTMTRTNKTAPKL